MKKLQHWLLPMLIYLNFGCSILIHPKFKYIYSGKKFWKSSATYPIGPIPNLDKLPDWIQCTKVNDTTNINTKYSYLFVTKGTLCISRNVRVENSEHPYELLDRLDINALINPCNNLMTFLVSYRKQTNKRRNKHLQKEEKLDWQKNFI